MASAALVALEAALLEVDALQKANPSPTGAALSRPDVTRAIGRASVVLLSSHFERYLHAVNEEAVAAINAAGVVSDRIPMAVRLRHQKQSIDELGVMQWANRGDKLRLLMERDAALWIAGEVASRLDHERLVEWMRSPKCDEVVRYFRQWGLNDILTAAARAKQKGADMVHRGA